MSYITFSHVSTYCKQNFESIVHTQGKLWLLKFVQLDMYGRHLSPQICKHTHTHTRTHARTYTCAHTNIVCVRACVRVFVCACVCACMCVCVCWDENICSLAYNLVRLLYEDKWYKGTGI